jgi:hypothetical protein
MRTFIGITGAFDRISADEIIVPDGYVEVTGTKRATVLKVLGGEEPPGLTKADANHLRSLPPEAKALLAEALSASASSDGQDKPVSA